MVARQRAPRRKAVGSPGRPSHTTSRERSETSANVRTAPGRLDYPPPRLGERYYFTCVVCGDGNADATYKTDRYGRAKWFVGCKSLRCEALEGGYLRALASKLGTSAWNLLEDPRPFVKMLPSSGRRTIAAGTRADLPSAEQFAEWSRRLLAEPEPLKWLRETRRVSLDVIERERIGWNDDDGRLTFPMFGPDGALVAAKHRRPWPVAQMRSWPGGGRAWPLFPQPDAAADWCLVVPGELDALAGRSAGLPACSVTLGAAAWRDEWTEQLRGLGLRVVVCYDNGEALFARMAADRLVAASVDATRFDLRRVGLRTPKGDLSDYLLGGGSARALRRAALGRGR